ncbi:sugar phosphate isomerase/epimerase family protein [Marinococcus luteus]|uniref:sugar phosphate isomerase/epimerase family protein n=1 Tax=Marinococcus luteus TaxID=1122204 RepID=UPI002ACC4F58|nr:sugar phosphate isomerase/epimerase family protein [Marinococcus luteus]MDZ5783493.1 sugar phosphate isomerase/epimerase family protein [Marinococcus luteus]
MKFSICSWIFGDQPIEQTMREAASIGYDEIEIHAKDYNWEELTRLAETLGLRIRGLCADAAWPRRETDLSQIDPLMRKKAVNYFKEQISRAYRAGAEYMVLSPCAPGKSEPEGNGKEEWKAAVLSLQEIAPYAEERNVALVIEPLNRYESCIINTGGQALVLVEEIGHPFVTTMLDTFHMNIEESSMEAPFHHLGPALSHIHVADNNRQGLGYGILPWEAIVGAIKETGYDATITVECLAPELNVFLSEEKKSRIDCVNEYAEKSLEKMQYLFRT